VSYIAEVLMCDGTCRQVEQTSCSSGKVLRLLEETAAIALGVAGGPWMEAAGIDALRLRDAEGHLLCEWGKWPHQEALSL
jgi:hypothetical protein